MCFRNAHWKGEEVAPEHFLFGSVKECGDGSFVTIPSEDSEEAERAKRFAMENTVLITMGNDLTSREGSFEIEIFAKEGGEIGIGMFATPYGEARNSEDSPWNLFAVQPVRWSVKDGVSNLQMGVGFRKYNLTEPVEITLESGDYHHFCMETDGKTLCCKIDGNLIMEAELPHYDEIQTVALEDNEEILLKIVNIAGESRPVEICLDTTVEPNYTAGVIAGEPSDKNSLIEPEAVTEHWSSFDGADRCFTHTVPANSVTVLRLKKKA